MTVQEYQQFLNSLSTEDLVRRWERKRALIASKEGSAGLAGVWRHKSWELEQIDRVLLARQLALPLDQEGDSA